MTDLTVVELKIHQVIQKCLSHLIDFYWSFTAVEKNLPQSKVTVFITGYTYSYTTVICNITSIINSVPYVLPSHSLLSVNTWSVCHNTIFCVCHVCDVCWQKPPWCFICMLSKHLYFTVKHAGNFKFWISCRNDWNLFK